MKKFEYKIVANTKEYKLEEELNSYGKKGWECFEIKRDNNTIILYFKREIIEENK